MVSAYNTINLVINQIVNYNVLFSYVLSRFSGYMSPEYASEGIYSVKSDVFSFGVLLLEILSGRRNSGFHQYEDFINLLGYVSNSQLFSSDYIIVVD